MKVLYVYYSRTGRTEAAILKLKQFLEGDALKGHKASNINPVVKLHPKRNFSGGFGFIFALIATLGKKNIPLVPQTPPINFADYELVVIAAPLWASSLNPVVRSFLTGAKGIKKTAYIISSGGVKAEYSAVAEALDALTGTKCVGYKTIHAASTDVETKMQELADLIATPNEKA